MSRGDKTTVKRNGKTYRRLVVWIEEDKEISKPSKNNASTKKSKTVNDKSSDRLRFKDIANTDNKIRDVCKCMEEYAPNCKNITELDRRVADDLFTDQWGYKKFNFVKSSPDDNIRKSMSDLIHGKGVYSNISKNYVIKVNGDILNNPTEEAKKRYDEENKPKVIKSPIFWYTDEEGNKINPYA